MKEPDTNSEGETTILQLWALKKGKADIMKQRQVLKLQDNTGTFLELPQLLINLKHN